MTYTKQELEYILSGYLPPAEIASLGLVRSLEEVAVLMFRSKVNEGARADKIRSALNDLSDIGQLVYSEENLHEL